MRRKPPTLIDVAERAGVSGQTISNYLTGRNRPRGQNLERIEKAIKELNYRPSAAARALRLKQSNVLAMLLEDSAGKSEPATAGWEPLHALFLHGAATKAREQGFYITAALTWHGETETHASRLVREGRADGLICSTEVMTEARLRRIQQVAQLERVPIVLLQESTPRSNICTVAAEDEAGAALAVRHLAELGHRQAAVMMVEPLWPGPVRRVDAFCKAARKAGMKVEKWVSDQYSIDSVRVRVAAELDRNDRPSAIFAVNDVVAVGVIQQAMQLGLEIPRDCSVVGFNDLDVASYFRPALTTIRTPASAMGARAAEILIDAVRGGPLVERAMLPVEFIVRDSTGPAPKSRHTRTKT